MRRVVWMVPVEWAFFRAGCQCISVMMTLMLVQRWLQHVPGDDRAYLLWQLVFMGTPGAFFLCRWFVRGCRRVARLVRWVRTP